MKYIDSHAHYLSRRFMSDRNEVLKKLFNSDLEYIIECGTNTNSNKRVLDLSHKWDKIYGVIGYFPTDVWELKNIVTWETLKEQLKDPKILAIGEIGLDYYHDEKGKEFQKEMFKKQLELAKELDLPVCIHSRDAEDDTLAILREFGPYKGVIHCFAYGKEAMRELVELGYYFGVGGTSTYPRNEQLRAAVRRMPLDRIVLETDCPYLAPQAVRGKRNDSSYIKFVIEEIASLKGVSIEDVVKQTNQNVKTVYQKLI
jgi:TatD DNase family protein